jgi:serine/threonine-protein kinase
MDSDSESIRFTPIPPRLLGGKYEAVEPVGRGGMASVWLGYTHGEAGFRRKVAIKRVLTHLHADERFEHMFVEEARVVAELNHPNIAQVHDFGRDHEGGYFIVMEWVEGMNLVDYVRAFSRVGDVPPWHLICGIGIEVLRALSAAHQRTDESGRPVPVIHRDVTPSNILIGVNGAVKLTDFGLARAMDRPRMTDPGTVKGKVAYMAPEMLENAKPDPRCDIYSVGVLLWESLTASRLFGGDGTDVQIALRILQGNVPAPTEKRPELPAEVSAIVLRALSRQPRDRYQRATEMIDALAQLLRRYPEPTDGSAIARSVRNAKNILPKTTNPPTAR